MLLGLLIQILPLSTSYTHTQKDNSTFALSEANAFEEAFDGAEVLAAAAERAGVAKTGACSRTRRTRFTLTLCQAVSMYV